jgi:beta-lactamase regulating signal transducer with metallopeptidase domain
MFALRGIAVSLTFFLLLYSLLSAIVALLWRWLKWLHTTERNLANLFFALRILPLAASILVTLAFVVPSFQLLEPRSSSVDEGLGAVPFALGVCALLLIACGCYRVVAARAATSRVVAGWLEGARFLDSAAKTVTFRSCGDAPPLFLVGVRKPRVLISESTLSLLSHDELRVALNHELAHIQSRDNLKKLIFRFCLFPGMSRLESAWSESVELAADDRAVTRLDDAVNLASALVKLSRLIPVQASPVCTVGFVTGTISVRVARLLAWKETEKDQMPRIRARYAVPMGISALFCLIAAYSPVLTLTHQVTEWLVR